jgi:hypothetical protein
MTYSELREKVEHQISQLPLERLFLVSSFIDSIDAKGDTGAKQLRHIPPLKRNKKASDLLRHAGTWQGDDLAECLAFVQNTRSSTHF